jgi:hypothetical protein
MQRSEPHWLLNDADAQRYGAALANALRHMPIKAAQKTIDYSTLVMIAFVMETPRIVRSIQLNRQANAPRQPQRGPAQVFQFHPPSPPAQANATPSANSPTAAGGSGTGAPPDFAEGPYDPGGFGGDAPT